MQDFNQSLAFIDALGGGIFDFRAVHDKRKDIPGISFRGTLQDCWNSICDYNNQGYGIFAVINVMDGNGNKLHNVQSVRAHFVDLDNLSAMENLERTKQFNPLPAFGVQSSPNKAHVYWPVNPYCDNDRFQLIQRKLLQFFDGDPRVIDAARIMRLPGTLHQKGEPHLVTCFALPGYGFVSPVENLEAALAHVNVTEIINVRKPLGDPELAAPSIEWLDYALANLDPNDLDRGEWIGFTSAYKQAGWSLLDQTQLFNKWLDWCARYEFNDVGENTKQWNSIRDTQLGWKSITYRVPAVNVQLKLGPKTQEPVKTNEPVNTPQMPAPPELDCSGEILTDIEQKVWFKDCYFIIRMGRMYTPNGFQNVQQFNADYGGKKFIIDQNGKITDEPWKAATRSTLWRVPKAHHIRFLPHEPSFELHTDALNRTGLNVYVPANIKTREGDPTPFLQWLAALLPVQQDQKYLLEYLAHNVKFPGYKIPWAPVIQSAEGVGKKIIKKLMKHAMGAPYNYWPKAAEMADSGSQFNAWMRQKLFIVVDEIRTDERRDMIEVLKPMISEEEIEIQGKGVDQDIEDNYSNWCFFTNWKDAVPINANGRRFSIFYSQIQTESQLLALGMNDEYFDNMFKWLENAGGNEIVTNYLMNYPIERGDIPMRSPKTSSTQEALRQSRGPLEQLVIEAIEDKLPGFCGGYVSTLAVVKRMKEAGMRAVTKKTIVTVLEQMGLTYIGRAPKGYITEDPNPNLKTDLYHVNATANPNDYATYQGQGYY